MDIPKIRRHCEEKIGYDVNCFRKKHGIYKTRFAFGALGARLRVWDCCFLKKYYRVANVNIKQHHGCKLVLSSYSNRAAMLYYFNKITK